MKKIRLIMIIVAVMAIFSLSSCSSTKNIDYVGEYNAIWKTSSLVFDIENMDLTISHDKTFSYISNGKTFTGTWTTSTNDSCVFYGFVKDAGYITISKLDDGKFLFMFNLSGSSILLEKK